MVEIRPDQKEQMVNHGWCFDNVTDDCKAVYKTLRITEEIEWEIVLNPYGVDKDCIIYLYRDDTKAYVYNFLINDTNDYLDIRSVMMEMLFLANIGVRVNWQI